MLHSPSILQQAVQLHHAGKFSEAQALYRQILDADPRHAEALHMLGVIAAQTGQLDEAVQLINHAITVKPNFPRALNNLGNALRDKGHLDEAITAYRRAIESNPQFADAHRNLGNALRDKGELDQAIASLRQAITLWPDSAEALDSLGIALHDKGEWDQAVVSFQKAIALKPDMANVHYNLGVTWSDKGEFDHAIACFQRALALKPAYADAFNNLGVAWTDTGQLDRALACFRSALALDPEFRDAHDGLLVGLHYHPACDQKNILAECQQWNARHAQPLSRLIQLHDKNRDPDRRLRIGYGSSDFHDHASAFFLLPLFRNHDRRQFDLFCYAQVLHPDAITRQMQDHVPQWRNTVGRDNADVAALVREDQIDILIDLKLHTADNRLLVFAHKPAPVQVTWLGYPGTTGMDTIDYRLTDPYLDPPGCDESIYSEQSFRLPDTFWCYDPLSDEPRINALPCANNEFVTFGCLNNFCKVNDAVISLWAKVLHAVPASRLILLAPEGTSQERVLNQMSDAGIGSGRIEMLKRQPRSGYLRTFHRIDIALDTFPYNGHTTSLDSFWMGVPVVTLVGKTVVGRAGLSQLSNLGLTDLIAHTPEAYIRIATDLAADRPRLGELRATLRQRMERSPLMDAGRFARNIEAAYRTMWRTWCAT